MESNPLPQGPAPGSSNGLSLVGRLVAVFARPTQAWSGLEKRGQWWFPLLILVLVGMAGMGLIYQRAVVPTQLDQMELQVESGQISAEGLDQAEKMLSSPAMVAVQVVMVLLILPLLTLATALLPWLAAGFMMGHRFRYRDAFAVTCWAGLVTLPAAVLTDVLAWVNRNMLNVHIGFGALLPAEEAPSKLIRGLGFFLDYGIGPFYLWYIVVLALGTAALSGAPRRSVILALGGLWLVVAIFFAALTGLLSPGA